MRNLLSFCFVVLLVTSCKSKNSDSSITTSLPDSIFNSECIVPACPDWANNAVFYEIYPQTFYDSNGDGIGDLKGIISKLDYVKSLGVNAIWLNPFYVSPFRDAGYDVADYYHVAPRYGTDADAKDLFRIAKEKGLRVIVDFVPGHTSIDHPWFKESSKAEPNKYSNWYIWTNGTWFKGMEKFKENFVQGYSDRDGNFMTNFFWHQPALNFGWGQPDSTQPWQLAVDHPDILSLRDEMKNIMRYWLDMGASGFRVDMAGSLVKNDKDLQIRQFWLDVRKMIDTEYPDAFLVSEWSHPYSAIESGFHADFMHWFGGYDDLFQKESYRNQFSTGNSFFDKEGKGDITKFLSIYTEQFEKTKTKGYISLPVGNHDLIRINNAGRSQKDLEIIYAFQMTMPGVPFIYNGDEIGMRQLPWAKPMEGAYGTRAGARTPMQWNAGKNLGFSTAATEQIYMGTVDTMANAPTVENNEANASSLLAATRKLVQIKRTEPALAAYAYFIPVYAKPNTYPFVYLRVNHKNVVLVALNPSAEACTAEFELPAQLTGFNLLAGDSLQLTMANGKAQLTMGGQTYSVAKAIK